MLTELVARLRHQASDDRRRSRRGSAAEHRARSEIRVKNEATLRRMLGRPLEDWTGTEPIVVTRRDHLGSLLPESLRAA